MNASPARIQRNDLLLLIVLSCGYALVVLTSQSTFELLNSDYPWYMNRADLIWRGVLDDAFVYTFAYPFFVGLLDLIFHNLIVSSLIFNTLCLILLFSGIYLLGQIYYNRAIAWIAIILLACNPLMIDYMRQMQTMILFGVVAVWCLVFHHYWVQYAKVVWAFLLGLCVGLAMYTRFEGALYGILFVWAGISVWRKTGNLQRSIGLICVAGITFLPFFVLYMAVLSRGAISSGTDNFIVIAFNTPDLGAYIARSFNLSFDIMLRIWSWALWLITLLALYCFGGEKWQANGWLWGLGIFHAALVFILTYYPAHVDYYPPVIAYGVLVFAWAIWRIGQLFSRVWGARLLTIGVCAILLFSAQTSLFANRYPAMIFSDSYANTSREIDQWLAENAITRVWTLCPYSLPYTQIETRYIYRFAGYFDDNRLPDSPINLLPQLYTSGDVFMHCDLNSANDWRNFLEGITPSDYDLEPMQTFTIADNSVTFRFFRVIKP